MVNNLIRPTAYELDPDFGVWTENFHVIAFSEAWRTKLLNLDRQRNPHREHPFTPPVKQLNSALRALAPGVVATGRRAGTDVEAPWIYARSPVPEAVIAPVVSAWILSGHDDEERAIEVLGSMFDQVPRWDVKPVDFSAAAPSSGPTADPERRLYSLVPEILAARIADRTYRSAGLDRDIQFRMVDREQGARLVSWPPHRFWSKGRDWFYSASIVITMQTVPFRPGYRIHVETGIRRWTTNSVVDTFGGRHARVALDVPMPWLDANGERAGRLIEHQVGYRRDLRKVGWLQRSPADLLPELDIMRVFPDPQEILREPRAWLEGRHSSIAAGVVHRNGNGPHEVEAGIFSGERAMLDAWIEEGFRPMLRRAPNLRRAGESNKPALMSKASKTAEPEVRVAAERAAAAARRTALIAGLNGDPLNIDILWQLPETRRRLMTALAQALGFPAPIEHHQHNQEWQFGGLHLRIRTAEIGPLGGALEPPKRPGLTAAAALGEAVQARRVAVSTRLAAVHDGIGLAFAEINGRTWYGSDADPKFALRLGLADTGRVSKFLVAPDPADKELEEKARWTILDGLRQVGAITIPERRVNSYVPKDLQYLALWIVRRRSGGLTRAAAAQLIAVRVRPGDDVHPVRGWDHALQDWVPYPQLLVGLARSVKVVEANEDDQRAPRVRPAQEQRDDLERRIRTVLFGVRDRPTLLLGNAANLRSSWQWLRNGSLQADRLGFGGDEAQRLAVYGPDLRLVLMRDSGGRGEVPQWYAPSGGDEAAGLAAGLWSEDGAPLDNRVFVSVTDKSHTNKKPKGAMKLGPHPAWPTAPSWPASNPQYLELVVLGCLSEKALADAGRDDVEPDKPSNWAALAHQLRFHDDYIPLARPLPMHLAKLAEDYVLPVVGEDES
ncbi:pPIWI_RE module domain-containing protein [Dactylosporangium sp. CA-139114]|uniref:pPIWI_RE module domain-containing protein n=1 Tax=Dactylosporangium sp. CA-139114 TaxID=3239931 RepID=UPI003D99C88A